MDDDGAEAGTCEVEFADGSIVIATCRREGQAVRLDVPAYRTARGTEVAARSWHVEPGRSGGWRTRRIG